MNVLLIDDDPIYRKTMEFVLPKLGLTAQFANSASEFLKLAENTKFDLFMVDLNLGHFGSGFELIRSLRALRGPKVPIIVVSGAGDLASITHGLEIGANDFIHKPMDKFQLASKLSRYANSEEIAAIRENRTNFPAGKFPVKLKLPAQILSIDELGVSLSLAHLIPKGTMIRLEGEWLKEFLPKGVPILVTVTSTWVETDELRFGAYAEFDSADTEIANQARGYIELKNRA